MITRFETVRRAPLCLMILALLPMAGICAPPSINPGGVINSADYGPVISSGSIVSIYGTSLAANIVIANETPLPTTLDGVSVVVRSGGQEMNAALFFVSAGQINAQLPYGLGGQQVEIIVRNAEGASNAIQVPVQSFSPRYFTKTQDGRGEALLVHHRSYELVSEASPAAPNEVVLLYLSGLGEVTPSVAAGTPAGDGASLGSLNTVNQPVEVWIGGQQATFLWAGLAPGFAGLYQVNLITPATLPTGMTEIVVRCGGGETQANVRVATVAEVVDPRQPEEVVRALLEAQARGDIDAALALSTSAEDPADIRLRTLAIAEAVRARISYSNLSFTLLAKCLSLDGGAAVVRAKVSFTQTSDAGTETITEGIMAVLEKRSGGWKVTDLIPDELIDQEVYEESLVPAGGSIRTAGLVNSREINEAVNKALNNGYFDYTKWAMSSTNAVVGKLGPWGNIAAQVYQVLDTIKNATEAGVEWWNYGSKGVIFQLKVKQTGVGLLQIATEFFETSDWMADGWQIYLEQITYNQEVLRGLRELKTALEGVAESPAKLNPLLFPPSTLITDYAAGVEFAGQAAGFEDPSSYGLALGTVYVNRPEALDGMVPLQVVGDFPVPSELKDFGKTVGGQERAGTLYLPVDLSYQVVDWSSDGESVLEGPSTFESSDGWANRHIPFRVTCRRGIQEIQVRLKNGEQTQAVRVYTFMDRVRELVPDGLNASGVMTVGVGQRREFNVIGRNMDGDQFSPNLSGRGECLDLGTLDEGVATVERGKPEVLNGEAEGATTLKFLLAGGRDAAPLEQDVPVTVGEEGPGLWSESWNLLFYNDWWNASFTASVATLGQLRSCEVQGLGSFHVLSCLIPPADANPPKVDTYTITTSISGVHTLNPNDTPPKDWEQKVYGQFDGDEMIEGGKDGGTFVKVLQVPRGSAGKAVTFSVIVYYEDTKGQAQPRWKAGATLFRFSLQR